MPMVELDRRKVRAAERREETRQRLLTAAVAVFAEQGWQGSTTKAITQRAGVAEGLLFHYFPTKADLLVAVLVSDPLGAAMRQLFAAEAEGPVVEALTRMAREWLGVIRGQGPLGRVLLEAAHVEPRVQQAILALAQSTTALVADYLAAGIARGELRPFDPRVAASMLLGCVFELGMPCFDVEERDEEQALAQQIDLLLHGMHAPVPQSPAEVRAANV